MLSDVAAPRERSLAMYLAIKRAYDIAAAAVGLPLALPAIAVAALLMQLQERGPVFHRSMRVGRGGRLFTLYKLRTMRGNADGPRITAADDPRTTSLSRWVRRAKVDELCQLINVVRGEMSIVGPRPEDPRYVALYSERQRRVLSVRPGITSPASVLFRHEQRYFYGLAPEDVEDHYVIALMPAKLEMDLAYIDSRSTLRDLRVLLQTVRTILS